MTTPTTPEQARQIAAYPITDWVSSAALASLADQVEALTKERDSAFEQNTVLDARCANLEAERDALAADAGRYQFITAHIVDEGDMDVLKRAFESLGESDTCTQAEFDACIDAAIVKEARQAGVQ